MEQAIIRCRNCGTMNRVKPYASGKIAICGKCRGQIKFDDSFPGSSSFEEKTVFKIPTSKVEWIKFSFVFLVVLALGAYYIKKYNPQSDIQDRFQKAYDQSTYRGIPSASRDIYQVQPSPTNRGSVHATQIKPVPSRSLQNGTIIYSFQCNGYGELTVKNGLGMDAEVVLVDKNKNFTRLSFYVASNSSAKINNIPDGIYRMMFIVGDDWDSEKSVFSNTRAISEFDKDVNFSTLTMQKIDGVSTQYTTYETTLHGVVGGDAKMHSITPEEFYKYISQTITR